MNKRIFTGTVSKITGLPKQTLIYYDKIGLLKPETYENGYRGYSYEDLEKLDIIMSLKETGLSLKEITEFMKEASLDKSIDVLEKQNMKLKEHIEYLNLIQSRIDFRVNELKSIRNMPLTQEIKMVTYPERYIVSFPIESSLDLSFGYALKAMRDHMLTDEDYKKYAHMVEGVMVDKNNIEKNQFDQLMNVFVFVDEFLDKPNEQKIFAGDYVVMQHHGTYDTTDQTYLKILKYLEDNDLEIIGHSIERTVLNYWSTGKEENYVTEIQIPVQKKLF